MSKSLGNFFTVRDLLDKGYPGEVIRFVMLSTHYRKPMDWTEKKAKEAETTLKNWRYTTIGEATGNPTSDFVAALADDLNVSAAISLLHKQYGEVLIDRFPPEEFLANAQLIGILGDDLGAWYEPPVKNSIVSGLSSQQSLFPIAEAIAYRWDELRQKKDFAAADALKKRALEAGLELAALKQRPDAALRPDADPAKLEALK